MAMRWYKNVRKRLVVDFQTIPLWRIEEARIISSGAARGKKTRWRKLERMKQRVVVEERGGIKHLAWRDFKSLQRRSVPPLGRSFDSFSATTRIKICLLYQPSIRLPNLLAFRYLPICCKILLSYCFPLLIQTFKGFIDTPKLYRWELWILQSNIISWNPKCHIGSMRSISRRWSNHHRRIENVVNFVHGKKRRSVSNDQVMGVLFFPGLWWCMFLGITIRWDISWYRIVWFLFFVSFPRDERNHPLYPGLLFSCLGIGPANDWKIICSSVSHGGDDQIGMLYVFIGYEARAPVKSFLEKSIFLGLAQDKRKKKNRNWLNVNMHLGQVFLVQCHMNKW